MTTWIHTDEAWPIAGADIEASYDGETWDLVKLLGYDEDFEDFIGEECMEVACGMFIIPCRGFFWRPLE